MEENGATLAHMHRQHVLLSEHPCQHHTRFFFHNHTMSSNSTQTEANRRSRDETFFDRIVRVTLQSTRASQCFVSVLFVTCYSE